MKYIIAFHPCNMTLKSGATQNHYCQKVRKLNPSLVKQHPHFKTQGLVVLAGLCKF